MSKKVINKRYEAINRKSLLLVVMLPDSERTRTIEFLNGYGLRNSAYLQTSDENLQTILDNDHRLNKTYRLAEINGMPIEEYEARESQKEEKEEVQEETEPKTEEPKVDEPTEQDEGVKTKTFKNAQVAKDWLNSEHGVPFHEISNKAKIITKAQELGFDLVFETDNK